VISKQSTYAACWFWDRVFQDARPRQTGHSKWNVPIDAVANNLSSWSANPVAVERIKL
jgi:hypothetical protein